MILKFLRLIVVNMIPAEKKCLQNCVKLRSTSDESRPSTDFCFFFVLRLKCKRYTHIYTASGLNGDNECSKLEHTLNLRIFPSFFDCSFCFDSHVYENEFVGPKNCVAAQHRSRCASRQTKTKECVCEKWHTCNFNKNDFRFRSPLSINNGETAFTQLQRGAGRD